MRAAANEQLQVAKELVALHSELRHGDLARLERLRRTAPAASSASRREQARPALPREPRRDVHLAREAQKISTVVSGA